MMIKRFCDRCKEEVYFNRYGKCSFNLNSNECNIKTTKGIEVSVISSTNELCMDCYQELIEFMMKNSYKKKQKKDVQIATPKEYWITKDEPTKTNLKIKKSRFEDEGEKE